MPIVTTNLVLNYDFSNTSCYPGSGTAITDLTGTTGSNGTLTNGATYSSDFGGIINFDGTNDYISVSNNANFNLSPDTNSKTISAWVKFNNLSKAYAIFGKFSGSPGFDGYQLLVLTTGALRVVTNNTTQVFNDSAPGLIVPNTWYFITLIGKISNTLGDIKVYLNTTEVINGKHNNTVTPSGQTATNFVLGTGIITSTDYLSGSIGGALAYNNKILTPSEITNNFDETKSRYLATNISISAAPATASCEFGTSPTITTNSNFNYEQSFISVTALMTEPTIIVTSGDYTNVTTSILVSAEFILPLNYGGTSNISNAADPMTASAEMPEHPVIVGSGIDFFAEEATASAEMIMPIQFGDPDIQVSATALIASNSQFLTPTVFVTPNYFNLIKQLNPAVYINGGLINYGYATPSTVQVQSTFTRAPEVAPMSYIYYDGSNNSYKFVNAIGGNEEVNVTGQGVTDAIAAIHADRSFTYEFWFKPNVSQQNGWDDGDSNRNIILSSDYMQFSVGVIGTTLNNTQANLPARILLNDSTDLEVLFNIPFAQIPSYNWHHFAIVGEPSGVSTQRIKIFLNGNIINNTTHSWTPSGTPSGNKIAFYPSTGETGGDNSFDELAFYGFALTDSQILDHYSFIENFDPNKIFYVTIATSSAEIINPNVIAVQNVNYPELPVTANALLVNPTIITQINISNTTTSLIANAELIEPFFYGNPDAIILADPATAYADIPPNIYRLDTAYYSYVQQNIAPFRYATFDSPNSNQDWGSDNDFGGAAPFTYGGSITLPINGLNNNSLLTDGLNYATSGLIMKESEHDDDWGTSARNWHTSFWIKKDHTDTNPNGLRIIANLHSYENNKHLIVYQYNNYLYLQMDDKVNPPQTIQSSVNVNVFDNVKHHIVITSKSDNKIQIYKNKILVLDHAVTPHIVTTNSTAYWAPNTETNNKARFSVGALITPYAETNLLAIPTPSIMYIDEAHWAVTHINQTGVNNLYSAMPFKVDIEWFADPALSNFSELIMPTFGTGVGNNVLAAEALNGQIVDPVIYTEIEKVIAADIMTASAEAVEPFSVIADNITNINIVAEFMLASALLLEHQGVLISIPGQAMIATANMISSKPYYDEYNLLIVQQTAMPLGASLFGRWSVGDIDS